MSTSQWKRRVWLACAAVSCVAALCACGGGDKEKVEEPLPLLCSDENPPGELRDNLPSAGTSTMVLMSFLDGEAKGGTLLFEGPSSFRTGTDYGCILRVTSGHYSVKIQAQGKTLVEKELDLTDGKAQIVGIYDNANGAGVGVAPLDLSKTPAGQARVVLLHLAQDNVNKPLDAYYYMTGDSRPDGTPTLLEANIPYGGTVSKVVDGHPVFMDYAVAGETPKGQFADRFILLAESSSIVMAITIWCDTSEVYEADKGPCYARSGGQKYTTILDVLNP